MGELGEQEPKMWIENSSKIGLNYTEIIIWS